MSALRERCADCDLRVSDYRVARIAGEPGPGRVDDTAHLSSSFDLHGQEAVLRGHRSGGTIFRPPCNMPCVVCQHVETRPAARGEPATPAEAAVMAQELQARGCHIVTDVSPTHHSPHLVK